MHYSSLWLLFSALSLACLPSRAGAQARLQPPDPVYGEPLAKIYRDRKVKEVYVEKEQFYLRKVIRPRSLHQVRWIEKDGQVGLREVDHNGKMAYRSEYSYYPDGSLQTHTKYQSAPQSMLPAGHDPKVPFWLPYEQTRYTHGKNASQTEFNWIGESRQWEEREKESVWVKNDTTYTETVDKASSVRARSRAYENVTDRRLLRIDYLTFSPKGLSEPKYYYYIYENGRTVESGTVDFSDEVTAHLERNPQDARYLFLSKNAFHPILDNIARHAQGKRQPTTTYRYDGKGRLLASTNYGITTTYARNAQGRALSSKVTHSDNSGYTTTYYFNAKGLLERQVESEPDGTPSINLFYRYVFY